jgi:hypothetical protein
MIHAFNTSFKYEIENICILYFHYRYRMHVIIVEPELIHLLLNALPLTVHMRRKCRMFYVSPRERVARLADLIPAITPLLTQFTSFIEKAGQNNACCLEWISMLFVNG